MGAIFGRRQHAKFIYPLEVQFPMLVVATFFHLVHARATIINGWITVFNPCGKHELSELRHMFFLFFKRQVGCSTLITA